MALLAPEMQGKQKGLAPTQAPFSVLTRESSLLQL
jgi:hypothetical protein